MLALALLWCILNIGASASFDLVTAKASIYLSAQAYCHTSTYYIRDFKRDNQQGQALLPYISTTECFMGYSSASSTIFVVYRGTRNFNDWVVNSDTSLATYPRCDDCKVHQGFYKAQQRVINETTVVLRNLTSTYPSSRIVVTGHSLGAAMATLTAVDLILAGFTNVQLFTFGSPRVGNPEFASYASRILPVKVRVTHFKEMPPHYPIGGNYLHIQGEWYEDGTGVLRECRGYEDPTCSMKWPLYSTNIKDHYHYLSHYVGCNITDRSNTGITLATTTDGDGTTTEKSASLSIQELSKDGGTILSAQHDDRPDQQHRRQGATLSAYVILAIVVIGLVVCFIATTQFNRYCGQCKDNLLRLFRITSSGGNTGRRAGYEQVDEEEDGNEERGSEQGGAGVGSKVTRTHLENNF